MRILKKYDTNVYRLIDDETKIDLSTDLSREDAYMLLCAGTDDDQAKYLLRKADEDYEGQSKPK